MSVKNNNSSSGSILGGTLLIAGCCIGAGMLGIPVMSALAGFQPSVTMFLLAWVFMVTTAFLLLEVNLWFTEDISIITMAGYTLGKIGQAIAWAIFLFLFYSLLVAYVAASGALFSDIIFGLFDTKLPQWIGSLVFTLLLAIMLYIGTRAVDRLNRLLMAGLIAAYITLVFVGAPYVEPVLLQHHDWSQAAFALPILLISFGFHNLIPSLTTYLGHNIKHLRITLLLGSIIPLFVYLVWEWLILGLVPIEGQGGFREALDQGQMATQTLQAVAGIPWVVNVAQAFAFFAIVTSFIGVALSFVDFLADGLKIKKDPSGKAILCSLVLLPPFFFAFIYPQIFLMALNYAGGIGTVILFGILPALMVWSGRYVQKIKGARLVPGGKITLLLVIVFSVAIMLLQLAEVGK